MKILPLNDNIVLVELKTKEIQEITGRSLIDVESNKLNVLNYGRIVDGNEAFKPGDVVLYQKLGAHKTNFGTPRQLLISPEHIEGKLDV